MAKATLPDGSILEITDGSTVQQLALQIGPGLTKAALAAAKARGVKLGKNGKLLARANITAAELLANDIGPKIQYLHRAKWPGSAQGGGTQSSGSHFVRYHYAWHGWIRSV